MELRHLRYFVTVAEELHFGRAAKRLNMSQPPLSRQIQELEEELGFPLLIREYHKVDLTAAGRVYLAEVRRILSQLEVAGQDARAVAQGRKGALRIGIGAHLPESYLSRVVAEFSAEHNFEIDILEAPCPRILQMLQQRSVNVAFVMTPFDQTGLVVKELMHDPLMIVVAKNHWLAKTSISNLAELAKENFVVCRRFEEPGFREVVENLCQEAGFTPRVVNAVEHQRTALDLVAEGSGVSILPQSTATPSDRVRYLPFPKPMPYLTNALAWREDFHTEAIESLGSIAQREAQRRQTMQV